MRSIFLVDSKVEKTKIELLTQRQLKIAKQIKQIQSKDGKTKRKLDTRRKILLGAICEKLIIEEKLQVSDVNEWLEKYLTKDRDRELFNGYFENLGFKKERLDESPVATGGE